MANERESPPVSGRRIESSSSAGLSMLRKAVLKNAPMTPMLPRSSHGVPGPGAIRLYIVCLRASSEAMATLEGGMGLAMPLSMREGMTNVYRPNDQCPTSNDQCPRPNDQRMSNTQVPIWSLGIGNYLVIGHWSLGIEPWW